MSRIRMAVFTLCLGAAAVAVSARAGAQDTAKADPRAAQPERPTVATHAGTVAPGYLEFEAGYERDRGPFGTSVGIATLVTKVGLARGLQLSIFVNGQVGNRGVYSGSPPPTAALIIRTPAVPSGFGDPAVGLKWRLLEEHPLLGDFAVLPILKVPLGDASVGSGTTDGSVLLISSRDAGSIHIDVNLSATVRSGDGTQLPRLATGWMVALSGPLGGPVAWTAEVYGYPGAGGVAGAKPLVGFLAGPMWTVTKSLVLDAGLITRLAGDQPDALFVGATWNAGRIWTP